MVHQIRISLFLLLIGAMFPGWGLGQAPDNRALPYRHYGAALGLNASEVYSIQTGPEDYLWVGTGTGLYRFDGHQFQLISPAQGYQSTLTELITPLEENLLLAIGGQPKFVHVLHAGKVVSSSPLPAKFPLGKGLYHQKGSIFSLSEGRALQFNLKSRQLSQVRWPGKQYPLGRLDRGSSPPLFYFSELPGLYTTEAQHLKRFNPSATLPDAITCLYALSPDSMLIWTRNGVFLSDAAFNRIAPFPIAPPPEMGEVRNVYRDRRGRIWFYPDHGGLYYWEAGRTWTVENEKLHPACQVNVLYEDPAGNLWIGTEGEGLLCLLASGASNYTVRDGLNSNYITALELDSDHRLWIGTNKGINILDTLGQVSGKANSRWKKDGTAEQDPFVLEYISDIASDADRMIISTSVYRRKLGWQKGFGERAFIVTGASLALSEEGELFQGRWSQLNRITYLESAPKRTGYSFEGGRVNDLLVEPDRLWIATAGGLLTLAEGDTHPQVVEFNRDWSQALRKGCFCLAKDHLGQLWVGSARGCWRRSATGWEQPAGLARVPVRALAGDHLGAMWIGTESGLVRYRDGHTTAYSSANGLVGDQIRELVADPERDLLWIGTANGLSALSLSQPPVEQPPELKILAIEELASGESLAANTLALPHDRNSLRIRFSGLYHAGPNEIQYQFRLLNRDSTWQASPGNEILLLSLSPGNYRVEIRCRIPGSDWGKPISLPLSIAAPIWQRTWFSILILLGTILLISAIFIRRARVARNRESEKRRYIQEIHHLEQSVINASLNPHFVFNAINSIQSFLIRHQDHSGIRFTNRLARLIRMNMDIARQKRITLAQEIQRLELYLELEKTRLQDDLNYQFEIREPVLPERLMIPNMILQPIVENAIWHGIAPAQGPGFILIRIFWAAPNELQIHILDNGVGLENGQALRGHDKPMHTSRGIQLIRKRIQFYHPENRLELSSRADGPGTLTRFVLVLPSGKSPLPK